MDRSIGEGGMRSRIHSFSCQIGDPQDATTEGRSKIVSAIRVNWLFFFTILLHITIRSMWSSAEFVNDLGIHRCRFSKQSTSTSNLGNLDAMMPRSGSRGSSPPTPGREWFHLLLCDLNEANLLGNWWKTCKMSNTCKKEKRWNQCRWRA